MLDVLSGFAIVIIVMGLGFFVGRQRLLGPNAVYTLNMYVFWIALPMLLIDFLSSAKLNQLFGTNFLVVALGTLGVHNFYLGYNTRGIIQLVLTILGWFTAIFIVGLFIAGAVGVWAFVEFIMILVGAGGYDRTAQGAPVN